jgi:acylphosphatase
VDAGAFLLTYFCGMVCKLIIVTGRVQGVYFRASARERAVALGITGTVRNLPDGSVEVVACGTGEQVQSMIAWCHEGPRGARVDEVKVADQPAAVFDGFRIVRG